MIQVLVMLWLAACAWLDWRDRQVPNWLALGPLPLALAARLIHPPSPGWVPLFFCALLLAGWKIGWVGGADVKGSLVLALLDPRLALAAWTGACVLGLLWRLFGWKKPRSGRMPGYPGFLLGVAIFIGVTL